MERDLREAEDIKNGKSLTGVAILNGDVEDVQDITHTEEAAKKWTTHPREADHYSVSMMC